LLVKIATIDIGTNSVLLLIAEAVGNKLVPVFEGSTITRLGQGVDETRRLNPDAVARTLRCLEDYAQRVKEHDVQALDVVTTSAARDALESGEFLDSSERVLGCRPRVIVGEEEARLTFNGALSDLDVEGPVAVYDSGGGSTEIVFGHIKQGTPPVLQQMSSIDIGCVRMTERHVHTDPPTQAELDAVRDAVDASLAHFPPPQRDVSWIGIGGTITTLAAVKMGLLTYDASKVHGFELSVRDVTDLLRTLGEMPLSRRQLVPGLDPKRADVIVSGGCVVQRLLHWTGQTKTFVSSRGVQWGLASEIWSRLRH